MGLVRHVIDADEKKFEPRMVFRHPQGKIPVEANGKCRVPLTFATALWTDIEVGNISASLGMTIAYLVMISPALASVSFSWTASKT